MYSEAGSTDTLNDKHVHDQALKAKKCKTSIREDRAVVTPIGHVQIHEDLSTKVIVYNQAPQTDIKGNTPTGHYHVYGKT